MNKKVNTKKYKKAFTGANLGDPKPSYQEFLKTVNPDFLGPDYDLEAAYNELPLEQMQGWATDPEKNHLPDTYKKPNHPTFSNESKYYDGITPGVGGSWKGDTYEKNPQVGPPMPKSSWFENTPKPPATIKPQAYYNTPQEYSPRQEDPIVPVQKKGIPGLGKKIAFGLTALDKLIPGEQIHNPIVRPQVIANEHPYGTGSQAIYKDGGKIKNEEETKAGLDEFFKQLPQPSSKMQYVLDKAASQPKDEVKALVPNRSKMSTKELRALGYKGKDPQRDKFVRDSVVNKVNNINSSTADFVRGSLPLPTNASQMFAKIFGDARMSNNSLNDEEKLVLWNTINNAKKRTGTDNGGTMYKDYAGEYGTAKDFEEAWNKGKFSGVMKSLYNKGMNMASTVGQGKYWSDPETGNMVYTDVYDWNASKEKNFEGKDGESLNAYQYIRNMFRNSEDKDLNVAKNDKNRMGFIFNPQEMEKLKNNKSTEASFKGGGKMPNGGRVYDAIPTMTAAINAYHSQGPKSKPYIEALNQIKLNYGDDTVNQISSLNSRLAQRGSADLNTAFMNIVNHPDNANNEYMSTLYTMGRENPNLLTQYQYGFGQPQNTNIVTKLEQGGKLSSDKSKEMLKDGTAHGKKLSDKQKRYFGMVAAGKAENGMSMNGDLQVEGDKYKALSPYTIELNGDSHADGGTDIAFGGSAVEAEKGEPVAITNDGSATVFGNLKNPLTGRKFKQDAKEIAKKEMKVHKYLETGTALVNDSNPEDKWEALKFNAGKAMMIGGKKKMEQLQDSKSHLADLQEFMNHYEEIKPEGKAKYGAKLEQAGDGKTLKDKFEKARKEAEDKAKILYPGMDVEVRVAGGARDISKQRSLNKSGASRTDVSLHNFNAANDMHIYVNGKLVDPTIGYNKSLYKQTVQAAAKANGLSTIGDWDVAHISAVKENNKDTFKRLKSAYPEMMSDETSTNTLKYLEDAVTKGTATNKEINVYNQLKGTNAPAKGYTPKDVAPLDGKYVGEAQVPEDDVPPMWKVPKWDKPRIDIPNIPKTYDTSAPPFQYQKDTPAPYSNAEELPLTSVMPELLTLATNKREPVWGQRYDPMLYNHYNESFQDKLNENNASFAPISRGLTDNASALSVLAGQKYGADSGVLSDEFRVNQGQYSDVETKNINLLNDATLKNINFSDQQYTRQNQANSATKEINHLAINSLVDKYDKNRLNNQSIRIYENMYPYYRFSKDGKYNKEYFGPDAGNSGALEDDGGYSPIPTKTVIKDTPKGTSTTKEFVPLEQLKADALKEQEKMSPLQRAFWKTKKSGLFSSGK